MPKRIRTRQLERTGEVIHVPNWRAAKNRSAEIHEAIREARETAPRLADETDHEHARRLGLLGERYNVDELGCAFCCDLPHRRHRDGCRGCGKPYAPEVLKFEPPTAQSSAGTW